MHRIEYGRSDVRILKDEKSKDEIRSKQSYGGFRMMARSHVAVCHLCGIGCPLLNKSRTVTSLLGLKILLVVHVAIDTFL